MKIVVVGDVLLDVDLTGSADRLCPDSAAPVVAVSAVRRRAGGAGLVAAMLADTGSDVELVTVLSDDENSVKLRACLEGVPHVAGPSGAPTAVKSRVLAAGRTVVRFDEGCAPAPVPPVSDAMLASLSGADAVVVADYSRGLSANPVLRSALEQLAGRLPVVWDPHPAGAVPVRGVRAVTPNRSELARITGTGTESVAAIAEAAGSLRLVWGCGAVIVTLGPAGVLLCEGAESGRSPRALTAPRVDAVDPCGAGDRFAAGLAAQLGHGAGLHEAAAQAINDAAAFLAAGGVARLPDRAQLQLLHNERVDALRLAQTVRTAGGTVVATGGCFDLLHAGHVRTLAAARALGDCLIVCLNSDGSTRRLKGADRPILGERDRVELLEGLESVDAVVVFDEDTPESVLEAIRPDVWVKGGDYSARDLPEAALLQSWGGQTVTVPYHPARSTTGLASALARVG